MTNFFIVLSLIPWFLCYLKYCTKSLIETNNIIITLKWFKKSIFKIFRFETLILIGIFIYFLRFENELVNIMLFGVICLYLFAASFHDSHNKINCKNFKPNLFIIVSLILITTIPYIFYKNTNDLALTYIILFAYLFFSHFLVVLITLIYNLIPKYKGQIKK